MSFSGSVESFKNTMENQALPWSRTNGKLNIAENLGESYPFLLSPKDVLTLSATMTPAGKITIFFTCLFSPS